MSEISKINKWLNSNTFDFNNFNDISFLEKIKNEKNYKLSVVIPTLEVEGTISNVLSCLIKKLINEYLIIDELIVIDGGSKDNTENMCRKFEEVKFYKQKEILTNYDFSGKGEALWKSLYVSTGDIIIYVDSDIKDFTERFVIGILGPMLLNNNIKFVKGYYNRPYVTDSSKSNEGGRVTELCARPLLNTLYPDLSGFKQPLGGEYGGFREVLENVEFTSGYGVEVQTLIEIYKNFGLDIMGQSNLIERIHRHQPLNSLSKMSFAIMKTILSKNINKELCNTVMIKNSKKKNSEFVKSRSESLDHCNCFGNKMDNDMFNYVNIEEVLLPEMSKIKESNLEVSL
jgi:glucosyl-3-phosphoglycerate synthase